MASDKTKMRNTDLRDARKLGLYPSVTNIIRILDKPLLTAWREEQMVMAALTLPHIEGETLDERARRVVRDAQSIVEDAAKRGKLLHTACEMYLIHGEIAPHPMVEELFQPFPVWARENILDVEYTEKTIVGVGYAGTLDLKAEVRNYGRRICDFKSRKPYNGKMGTYPEDGYQLAAYLEGDALTNKRADGALSILINSQEPSEPHVHAWDAAAMEHGWEVFKTMFKLWKLLKNYEPTS